MALRANLTAAVENGTVGLRFAVTNEGETIEKITYRDAGKAEFVVERASESEGEHEREEHWRYSDGRVFAQVIGTERLEPGESTVHECRLDAPGSGTYVARATLRALDRDVDAEHTVSIDG